MVLTIDLYPFENIEPIVMEHLQKELATIFNSEVLIEEKLPLPASAFNSKRKQYFGNYFIKTLKECAERKKSQKGKTLNRLALGVCDVDLYVEGLNFIFGLASPYENGAVISLARLREEFYSRPKNDSLFLLRTLKEAVHELGHLLDLSHCSNRKCVMYFSNSLMDTDIKEANFCKRCQEKLSRR